MKRLGKRGFALAPMALLFFVGTVWSDRTGVGVATLLAAALHELGHLMAAAMMKIPLGTFRLELLGARIEVRERLLSYGEEWLLAAAGPIFSLLGAAAMAPLWGVSLFARAFSAASLLLGVLNLLPVKSFDGGRMTEVALCRLAGVRVSCAVVGASTLCFLFLLWALSVYLLLRAGGGITLFCFSASILARFLEEGKIG